MRIKQEIADKLNDATHQYEEAQDKIVYSRNYFESAGLEACVSLGVSPRKYKPAKKNGVWHLVEIDGNPGQDENL